jgi:hypothetical protein
MELRPARDASDEKASMCPQAILSGTAKAKFESLLRLNY